MNRRRLATLLLAVSILSGPLAGCASAAKSAQLSSVDDSIQRLAGGGIAVMDDFRSTTPVVALTGTPSAMRFTRWQMQNLVAEANAHTGYLGGELDTIGQPPAGAPPLSTIIGAWLTRKDGALAQYAAGVMGTADYTHPAQLVFPTIVVLTFIGDIARVAPATAHFSLPHVDLERLIATPADAFTPPDCTDIAGWVSSVVNSVTSAIQANGTGWLASIWNTVVSVAGVAISVAIGRITGFITTIATICGTLMQVASMFKPWSVQLAADPGAMKLSSTPGKGKFVATLNAADVPWPSSLIGCVQALSGVTLKDASYTGAPVTWNAAATTPGIVTSGLGDATLQKDKTATYHFETITVPPVDACPRTRQAGNVAVTVTVARSDITRTLNSLESLITNMLSPVIQKYFGDFIQETLSGANSTAAQFAAPHESGVIPVSEDFPDPLCVQSPTSNSPTMQPTTLAGHGTLPGGPCAGVALPADTEPSLKGGLVFIPTDQGQQIDIGKMMGQLMGGSFLQAPNVPSIVPLPSMPHGPDYDASAGSWCVIGTPPDKIVAFFGVIPKGAAPYHLLYDLRTADAQHPLPCRSVIGIDLLNYYNADCRDGTFAQGVASETLYGPTVEYIIVGGGELAPGTTASDLSAVLRHIAERSRN